MKNSIATALLFCSCLFDATCQNLEAPLRGHGTGGTIGDVMLIKGMEKGNRIVGEVEGTPYLNPDYIASRIITKKGTWTGIPMKYNIYDDVIEFKQANLQYTLDPQPLIDKINLGEQTLVVRQYESKGKLKNGYFLRLDSGKVTLLAKKYIVFRERQEPKALESSATPAKYFPAQDTPYYQIGGGLAVKVGSLKSMLEAFPDKQEEMKAYAKKEKISAGNEEELLRLVKYYNSL